MTDLIEVTFIAQRVWHDGKSMVVKKAGETAQVSPAQRAVFLADGGIAGEDHLPQLDHNGDGKPGGSKPGDESTAALGDARKRYHAAFGKNPGPRWDVAKIEEMIAAGASSDGEEDDDDAAAAPPVD